MPSEERAVRIARAIVERLIFRAPQCIDSPSLADGALGCALAMHAAFGGDPERAASAHELVRRSAAAQSTDTGLFTGASGLYFTLGYLRRGPKEYAVARSRLARAVADAVRPLAAASTPPVWNQATNVYTGSAGVRLAFADDPEALGEALSLAIATHAASAMRTIRSALAVPVEKAFELGVLRGVAGGLCAETVAPGGRAENLSLYLQLLLDSAGHESGAPAWPALRYADGRAPGAPDDSWGFGTPGICVALAQAAAVLGDRDLAESVRAALGALALRAHADPSSERYGIARGLAGIALAVAACGLALGDTPIVRLAHAFATRLMDAYDDALPLGYREHAGAAAPLDDAGLLEGAAGIALVLLTLAGAADPSWTRTLGILHWPAHREP